MRKARPNNQKRKCAKEYVYPEITSDDGAATKTLCLLVAVMDPEQGLGRLRVLRTRIVRPGDRRSVSRAATRALDVLELFGRLRRPLRAVEIARALSFHTSTADQLLKTLVESAHLTFDSAAKTYFPSPRLVHFGAWIGQSYGGEERLRGLVRDLHSATGEIVTMSTPNGLFMQIIDLAGAGDESTERGLRASIFGTAIGAVYLSTLADAEITRLANRARLAPADLAAIREQIAAIQLGGVGDGPSFNGAFWSAAAAIPSRGFPAPLVLGVAGPAARLTAKLDDVRTALLRAISQSDRLSD